MSSSHRTAPVPRVCQAKTKWVNPEKTSSQPKNTVATILKTMVEKGIVRVENVGRIHRYHPTFSKDDYSKDTLTNVAKGYFEGSFSNVVTFLVDEKKLSVKELELLLQQLRKNKK